LLFHRNLKILRVKKELIRKIGGENMQEAVRRSIGYIVGRYISNKRSSSVYDYTVGRHFSFSGDINLNRINIFDYTINNYISGDGTNNKFNLYHYGTNNHITIEFSGDQFKGYDYDSGQHFSGRVRNTSVSIYDYETTSYYQFTV
jgi:hypothetical protein